MKAFIKTGIVAVAICALASIAALAGDKDKVSKNITFTSDTAVNGKVVKAGDYELKFDKQTNELKILSGGKVVATATAEFKQRDNKAPATTFTTRQEGNNAELTSVTFGGSMQDIVITGGNSQVTGN